MADSFSVQRSTTINAPAAMISTHIVDLHKWVQWSPWEGIDPNLSRTYGGPDSGVGASYAWAGTRKVGQGSMKITSVSSDAIGLALQFIKPFKANNEIQFDLVPASPAGTTVTWTLTGKLTLLNKVVGVFLPMDKLVGKDFAKGLAQLKALVEKSASGR